MAETLSLSERVRVAVEALEPFKEWADVNEHVGDDEVALQWAFGDRAHFEVTMSAFRRARQALALLQQSGRGAEG